MLQPAVGATFDELFVALIRANCNDHIRQRGTKAFTDWAHDRGPAKIYDLTVKGLSTNPTLEPAFQAWIAANRATCEQMIAGAIGLV